MDGIKPLALTFIVWVGAQLTDGAVPGQGALQSSDIIFGTLSSALILALLAAGIKYGRLLKTVETLISEVDRLRKRLDK
jgi:hypothetical protein